MGGEGLVDGDFGELGGESCSIEVGLGEDLECEIPAIDHGFGRGKIKVENTDVTIIADGVGGRTGHDLTDKIHDSVAACSEPTDDLEFFGSVHICDRGSEDTGANGLALKK